MSKEVITPTTNRGVIPPNCSIKSSYSSIDWLTVTTDKRTVGYAWADIFSKIAERNGHAFTRGWSFWGYDGVQTDHCRYGQKPGTSEFILIVSSSPADEVWLKICPTAKSITRIDLAVTVSMEFPTPGIPSVHYLNVLDIEKPSRLKYSWIQNNNGGETFYVGSRQSEQFGRVYDKSAERKQQPGGSYRYEVVLKKDVAPNLVKALLAASLVRGSKNALANRVTAFVWDWFDARNVTPIFDRGGGR